MRTLKQGTCQIAALRSRDRGGSDGTIKQRMSGRDAIARDADVGVARHPFVQAPDPPLRMWRLHASPHVATGARAIVLPPGGRGG
ncbi:MAG: hypothetical protein EOP90_10005 [Lysobacteraceae bacterium]|nr:MAG: hypothetical protein EOP90_10005 [Xanthomonadaceae bacterium]